MNGFCSAVFLACVGYLLTMLAAQGNAWVESHRWLVVTLAVLSAISGVGAVVGFVLSRQRKTRSLYRIEVSMNSGPTDVHRMIVEAYLKAHPDPEVAKQLRANVMSRELAEHFRNWIQPRLASMGLSGGLRLVDINIQPPAAIRMRHAQGVAVSGNHIDVDPGISGIDAEQIKDAPILENSIRIKKS